MTKAARGTKRICKSCGGKFYDLNREPIVCPLCAATYETEEAPPQEEPVVVEAVAEKPKPEPEAAAPAPEPEAAASDDSGPELVSLDEAQAEEEGVQLSDDDDDIVDLPDDGDADIPEAEGEDDAFLEEDDEAEPDVEGIIGGPLKPEDEA